MDIARWLPLVVWGVIGGGFLASFASLVAWRVPRGQSVLRSSFCPTCGHGLGPIDLVPVVSWLLLRGRCRYCGSAIPPRELVVEALGMVMGVAMTATWGVSPSALFYGCFVFGLLAIALADLERYEVPLAVILALAGVWLAGFLFVRAHGWLVVAPRPLWGLGVMLAASAFGALVTRGRYGGGDWLIGCVMGLFLGPYYALIAWFGANLLALPLAVGWRRRAGAGPFPFGPALAVASTLFALPPVQLFWLHVFPYQF